MYDNKFDIDTEFMSDEEVNEMVESAMMCIAQAAADEDNQTMIVIPDRIGQVANTYKILKYLTKGTNAKVSYKLHQPYKSMGCVSVVGKNLQFKNTEWFLAAVNLASNFEVYPKTDGTVQMNFTFHGLTQVIE